MGLGEAWFRWCNKPLADRSLAMAITFQRGCTSRASAGVSNLRGPTVWKGRSIWSMASASAEGSCPTSSASEGAAPFDLVRCTQRGTGGECAGLQYQDQAPGAHIPFPIHVGSINA